MPVGPRFYYFTVLLFYCFTILLFCYFTILLFYYFTILRFYYFTNLLILREIGSLHLENPPVPVGPRFYHFTDLTRNPEKILLLFLLLIGFPPRPQQFASRKPTRAGWTQILLFYYFTILLFYYFTILLFYYFTILLFYYLLFYYFTILLFYYFAILLFYYFTIFTNLPRNREFASRKPTCAGWTQILPLY